jgi:hypothetical protein
MFPVARRNYRRRFSMRILLLGLAVGVLTLASAGPAFAHDPYRGYYAPPVQVYRPVDPYCYQPYASYAVYPSYSLYSSYSYAPNYYSPRPYVDMRFGAYNDYFIRPSYGPMYSQGGFRFGIRY